MFMNNKKKISIWLCIVIVVSIGIYTYKVNVKNNTSSISNNEEEIQGEKNKYYCVYLRYNEGEATTFLPLTLNKGYKIGDEYNMSINIDDDGDIEDDSMLIVIDDFIISKENEKKIKEIAGKEKYDEAINEIQTKINETKENLKMEEE